MLQRNGGLFKRLLFFQLEYFHSNSNHFLKASAISLLSIMNPVGYFSFHKTMATLSPKIFTTPFESNPFGRTFPSKNCLFAICSSLSLTSCLPYKRINFIFFLI